MKRYRVRVLPEAEQHIERLFDHVVPRELESPTGDLQVAFAAMAALRAAFDSLSIMPYSYRKVDDDPFWRELVIPFGRSGYVALFTIREGAGEVWITKVRHQLEDDYL